MIDKQEHIRNAVGASLLDEFPLKRNSFVISNEAEPPDLQLAHVTRNDTRCHFSD